jgi:hypothetical protein
MEGTLLHYGYTVVTLFIHCCYSVVTLLSHSCYNVVTLLTHCCYSVVTLLLFCDTFLILPRVARHGRSIEQITFKQAHCD